MILLLFIRHDQIVQNVRVIQETRAHNLLSARFSRLIACIRVGSTLYLLFYCCCFLSPDLVIMYLPLQSAIFQIANFRQSIWNKSLTKKNPNKYLLINKSINCYGFRNNMNAVLHENSV